VPWLAAAAAALLGYAAFPAFNRYNRDELHFARAVRASEEGRSVEPLRAYLADPGHVRHRAEAQRRIDALYQAAIARLRDLSANQALDPELFRGLLDLVESLRSAGSPDVSVGFVRTQEPEPVTKERKGAEQREHDCRLREHEELRRLARSRGTAILPLGGTFRDESSAHREEMILRRLSESVRRVLGADLLSFRSARAGEAPMLEVRFHVRPSGILYTYTMTRENRSGGDTKTVEGLLRGYEIDWTLTLRPYGAAAARTVTLGSSPVAKLHYRSRPTDPEWAPYAVILYSCFYDFSDRLIRNFGVDPGPVPDTFTFGEAVRT
jgi:hypothetical protein